MTMRTFIEIVVITAIFAAAGAWPVPDTNEAVYLTKARHAGDPNWIAGDFFLESKDAHGIFFVVLGPLAARLPLETTAWLGRLVGWLALAVGFRHLAAATVTEASWSPWRRTWAMLVAASIFSLALRQTHAAGEWVIGGCEAKVFAWALVFGGLGELVRGRFASAWCLCGAGTAFHPIVGGWAMVAATAVRLVMPWPAASSPLGLRLALLVVGGLFAAAGVMPALGMNYGVDPATRQLAARIYVVERLPHHLLVQSFATGFVARHLLAACVWWLLARVTPSSETRQRLTTFTLIALGISLTGVAISLTSPWTGSSAYELLRFYWFRLADVAVPLALAVVAAVALADDAICRQLAPLPPRLLRGAATLLLLADLTVESQHWPVPGCTVMPRADSKVDAAAWADICAWIRDNTPPDACLLTPRGAATLGWRTGRREVVSWKNSPQDAASLVAWRRRITDCFSRTGSMSDLERSTATLGEDRLRAVAKQYGATHAIVPRDAPGIGDISLPRLHANDRYAVFEIVP
jgi:hypothetical protein